MYPLRYTESEERMGIHRAFVSLWIPALVLYQQLMSLNEGLALRASSWILEVVHVCRRPSLLGNGTLASASSWFASFFLLVGFVDAACG